MSHVKAGGTSKNTKDSPGQRLGVKRFGGHKVRTGEVIIRQIGRTKLSGDGTFISRDFTIHAAKDGIVDFRQKKIRRYSGKTVRRTEVIVK
jgi:large subunit ribosomal protein L27